MKKKAKAEHAVLLQVLTHRSKSTKCFGHYMEFDTSDFLAQIPYKSCWFYDLMERLDEQGFFKKLSLSRNHVKFVLSDDFALELKPFGVTIKYD